MERRGTIKYKDCEKTVPLGKSLDEFISKCISIFKINENIMLCVKAYNRFIDIKTNDQYLNILETINGYIQGELIPESQSLKNPKLTEERITHLYTKINNIETQLNQHSQKLDKIMNVIEIVNTMIKTLLQNQNINTNTKINANINTNTNITEQKQSKAEEQTQYKAKEQRQYKTEEQTQYKAEQQRQYKAEEQTQYKAEQQKPKGEQQKSKTEHQKPKGELQLTNPISNNKDMNYHIDWLNDKVVNITENKTDYKILLSFSNTSTMNLPSNLEITEAPNSSIHFSIVKLQGKFAPSITINKAIYLKTGKLNAGIYDVYIQLRDSTNQENIGEQLKLEVIIKGISKRLIIKNDDSDSALKKVSLSQRYVSKTETGKITFYQKQK